MNKFSIGIQFSKSETFARRLRNLWLLFLISALLGACSGFPFAPQKPVLAKELVLYNWADYMPQTVLDAFEKEYGVKIVYMTYDSAEEAASNRAKGRMQARDDIDGKRIAS